MAPVQSKIAPPGLLSMFAEAAHRKEQRINLPGARKEFDSRLKGAFGINTRQKSYKGTCGHKHFYNIGVNGDSAAHILDYVRTILFFMELSNTLLVVFQRRVSLQEKTGSWQTVRLSESRYRNDPSPESAIQEMGHGSGEREKES